MSTFECPECGALCVDTPTGYITGCNHYPVDRRPTPEESASLKRYAEFEEKLRKPYKTKDT